ncbi:MAG: hypothetical protein OXR82_08495 [Gammaproteobacteria bacterium]|nr:hypothetical protein [Gammaproteobacteria bacterium]MDE0258404.1 hypothetical protein [Gammaproteobacteria bacterium]
MSELAALLESIAPLLWPLLALFVVLRFAKDISGLLSRIKKASILGGAFELHPDSRELQEVADLAVDEAVALPPTTTTSHTREYPRTVTTPRPTPDAVESVLETAAVSPTAGLLLLAREIEKEGRDLLASVGDWKQRVPPSFLRVIARLDQHYGLPKHITSGLSLFHRTRNRLIHGGRADDREILSVLDSGVSLYRALRSLPRERHWVQEVEVPIYSDEQCLHEIPGAKGVIIKTESPGDQTAERRIFPSTRTNFKKGARVSWEWNLDKAWPDAWYRHPDSDEVKRAWESSGEFVGRHFEDP